MARDWAARAIVNNSVAMYVMLVLPNSRTSLQHEIMSKKKVSVGTAFPTLSKKKFITGF